MYTQIRTLAGVVLLSLVLIACGGGGGGSSSSGGGSKPVNVVYTLDPVTGPDCKNTSSINRENPLGRESVTCFWRCANYKGQSPVWVSIHFVRSEQDGNRWQLFNDTVLAPRCG